jgi:hypothetical protein
MDEEQKREGLEQLVVVTISRFGPLGRSELAASVRAPVESLDEALGRLVAAGRIRLADGAYSCDKCVIPFGEPSGWEAALFDHYQAMVTAVCIKLRRGTLNAALADSIGGSTYTFDIWEGHPLQIEVLGLLRELRQKARGLRERVEAFNRDNAPLRDIASNRELRVITYVGQGVLESESMEGDHEW